MHDVPAAGPVERARLRLGNLFDLEQLGVGEIGLRVVASFLDDRFGDRLFDDLLHDLFGDRFRDDLGGDDLGDRLFEKLFFDRGFDDVVGGRLVLRSRFTGELRFERRHVRLVRVVLLRVGRFHQPKTQSTNLRLP